MSRQGARPDGNLEATSRGSGGGFRHDTWWIHTPGDDPRAAQYASAHESHHQQLEATTSFGNLTRVAVRLSRLGKPIHPTLVADLVGASRATHEAFASWMPAFVLGWTREEITTQYLEYERDYDAMDELVGAVRSPYLRLHSAHALARLCMQPEVLDVVRTVGFENLRLGDLRQSQRPDGRLRALRRHPPPIASVETAMSDLLIARAGVSEHDAIGRRALELVAEPTLSADMLAPNERDVFGWVNAAVYALLAQHAGSLGLDSLGHEEHVAAAGPLLEAATAFAGVDVELVSDATARPPIESSEVLSKAASGQGPAVQAHARRAVGSVDFEQFSVAAPLNARWAGTRTGLVEMVAGLDDPHLFLAIRTAQQVRENYRFGSGSAAGVPGREVGAPSVDAAGIAFVRRTVVTEDELSGESLDQAATAGERVVELLDVTDSMPARARAPVPVVTSVAMSLLGTPVAQRFAEYSRTEISTLLVDVPLEPHLNLWLSGQGTRVRWVLLRTEGHGRVVPVLILRVENDGARSHLMVKPVSHAAAGIYRAGFEEVDPSGERLVADPGLLEDDPELLQLTLSHLVGEEVLFGLADPG